MDAPELPRLLTALRDGIISRWWLLVIFPAWLVVVVPVLPLALVIYLCQLAARGYRRLIASNT